ncbi:VTS1 [Candida theae]|uniref:RNA-binding protein VTS1 n=1 Tax=Candida theae TaxID=1198502 RepID=A0AAD5G0K4_9ASCO|nr:VTS1 [Candida theae]KAI5967104.1 VTS1 [Candida theae]
MDQSESKQSSLASSQNAPIVLSPPPLEHTYSNNLSSGRPHPEYLPSQRQQSVGYNLQHEFETLTAKLDLDLKNQGRSSQSAPPFNEEQLQSSSNLIAPAATNTAITSSNLLNLGSSASDINSSFPQVAAPKPQLSSLLENRVQSSQATGGFLQPPSASIPDRPQSAHDFTNIFRRRGPGLNKGAPPSLQQSNQSNLYSDLLVFSNWIENLSPQDTVSMIDYLCASLPVDVLLTFQAKLDQHLQAFNQPSALQNPLSPYGNTAFNSELDMESLSLNDQKFNQPLTQNSGPFSSEAGPFSSNLSNIEIARPRSADPFLQKNQQGVGKPERSKSPTSHLHEKTNFLQLAANNNVSPYYYGSSPYYPQQVNNAAAAPGLHQDENLDMSNTALKLGALATINSRVALDSNRKHPHGAAQWNNTGPQPFHHGNGHHHNLQHPQVQSQDRHNLAMSFENSINRGANSASVPVNTPHRNNYNALSKKKVTSPNATGMQHSNMSTNSINSQTGANGSSSMPSEVASPELLNNIPAWLKLLRLHKYTDCLKDMYWKDLIELNNEQLEEKGVAALGARRKLLKAFEAVKNSQQ